MSLLDDDFTNLFTYPNSPIKMGVRSNHSLNMTGMYSTISMLVGLFENLGEVEKAIIEALSKEVTLLDESKVRSHILVKGNNLYTEISTFGDISNEINGTSLTLSSIILCKG